MTADVELVFFFFFLLFISRREAPLAENSLSLEVPLSVRGCRSWLPSKLLPPQRESSSFRRIGLAVRDVWFDVFTDFSPGALGGDGDCISVHEPGDVKFFPAPLLGWLYLGLYPSIASQRIHGRMCTRMCTYVRV